MKNNLIDITGQKFGMLTAKSKICLDDTKKDKTKWLCECECGRTKEVSSYYLRKGLTKSCGNHKSSFKHPELSLEDKTWRRFYLDFVSKSKRGGKKEWDIDLEYLKQVIKQDCYYCGSKPSNVYKGATYKSIEYPDIIYQGLDRINSDIGYLINNIVPCCYSCNSSKSNKTQEEFINMCITIAKKHK